MKGWPSDVADLEPPPSSAPGRWNERLADPLNRFYRSPLARFVARGLRRSSALANLSSLVQPFLAAGAGYALTFPDRRHVALAALLFELRSVLARGSVLAATPRREGSRTQGGSALGDGLAAAFLYAGIFWHFRLYAPSAGAWSHYISVGGVLFLALAQGGLRSLAADYYQRKYRAIFETGRDGTVHELCQKAAQLGPASSVFERIDVLVGRAELLAFEQQRFDPARTSPRDAHVRVLRARDGTPFARLVALVWSISNGDAFLSLVTLAMVTGRLWESQLFFALAGLPWLVLVVALNTRFARAAAQSATDELESVPARAEGAWAERTARSSAPP